MTSENDNLVVVPLSPGKFMLWRVGSGVDPFKYFQDKYGYMPTLIGIGRGVDIEIPQGVGQVTGLLLTPYKHIKLR